MHFPFDIIPRDSNSWWNDKSVYVQSKYKNKEKNPSKTYKTKKKIYLV